jgi:hypothetical protein
VSTGIDPGPKIYRKNKMEFTAPAPGDQAGAFTCAGCAKRLPLGPFTTGPFNETMRRVRRVAGERVVLVDPVALVMRGAA